MMNGGDRPAWSKTAFDDGTIPGQYLTYQLVDHSDRGVSV